jgi:STE24 endopeptidase
MMLALLLCALGLSAIKVTLLALNLRHLARHGGEVPPELADQIDAATLAKSAAYTRERTHAQLVFLVISRLVVLAALFGGFLASYERWVAGRTQSFVLGALLYAFGLSLVSGALSIPFGWYQTFVIEARHGFNRMTLRMWLSDLVKGALLSAVFLASCVASAAALVQASPEHYWLWIWALLAALGLLLTLLAPHLIEPLFFKTTPLSVPGLEPRIVQLAERAGVHVKHVLQMDASRRSSHSNAYFTGIGPVKRVVLFDTLVERMSHAEILGVLAHELGHWRRHHIAQRFVLGQVLTLAVCYGAFRLISWPALPTLIGETSAGFFLRATLVAFLGSMLDFLTTPLSSAWSRKHEWEADQFARELTGDAAALASALGKLARDNLANLHPHPLFAAFYASHPNMKQRVAKLRTAPGT